MTITAACAQWHYEQQLYGTEVCDKKGNKHANHLCVVPHYARQGTT